MYFRNIFAFGVEVKDWWDGINVVFQINKTGTILANANANKYDSNVPIFED